VRKTTILLYRFVAGVLAAGLCSAGPALADEIFLKGGAKFTGRIEQQTDTLVTIDLGDGVVGVAMSRVEKIVKGRSPLDEFDERARGLGAQDAAGWRTLGGWASRQGLSAQSRQAYQTVLTLTPDDQEARQALGFVLTDGRWLTEEESYRARGFVQVGGEWMTPAAAQQVQAVAASDQARQDAERRANQAEADKILAESRAAKAEERAREAEEVDPWTQVGGWGGWGYGVSGWPAGTTVNRWPAYQPPPPPLGQPTR